MNWPFVDGLVFGASSWFLPIYALHLMGVV